MPPPGGGLREAVECPHCAEPTLPNLLADGTLVCSCAAERPIAPALPRGASSISPLVPRASRPK